MRRKNDVILKEALAEVLLKHEADLDRIPITDLVEPLVERILAESWVCTIPDKFTGFLMDPFDYEQREAYSDSLTEDESNRFKKASDKANRLGMFGYQKLKDIEEAEEL